MPVSCIIWDLDGTLIDSASDIAAAINRLRAHYDLPPLSDAQVREFIGDGAARLVERAILGIVDDPAKRPQRVLPRRAVEVEELIERFRGIYGLDPVVDTRLYPGVLEALKYWNEQGAAQVVLTNKPHSIARAIVEILEIRPYIELVLGRGALDEDDQPLPCKPDPLIVDWILAQTGAPREETWIVGDGDPDIETATNAGVPCVVILGGYGNPQRLIEKAPDLECCVTDLAAADRLLRGR